jgi:putative acetyltransferase
MITCIRTDSENKDFQSLVRDLDAFLRTRDGDEHSFYAQYNKIDSIKHVIMAYDDNKAVGCGAIKHYADYTMEVKRMFVPEGIRGKGIASLVLAELEKWAKEMGYKKCILETGKRQTEAIALYNKNSYVSIPNFGQYAGKENSVCFEKTL